jgi:hypothetical protein
MSRVGQGAVRVEQHEAVQRVAVPGGVDLGFGDAVAEPAEEAAQAGEEVRLVGSVDHHLQALIADMGQAGLHHRLARRRTVVEGAGVPGDLLRVVAQEIDRVEFLPEGLLGAQAQAEVAQQAARLLLPFADAERLLGRGAAQQAQGGVEEILQQLALPAVPDLGAGAADVGDGEQVERRQPAFVADEAGESAHHFRIGQILLLGDVGHRQVMLDQPDNQGSVFLRNAVFATEATRVRHAQLRVVAAAALGDVVEEGGE